MTSNKSHLTAIGRKTLPVPTRWLLKNNLIKGKVLDYGCGRCHSLNNAHFDAHGFDPCWNFPQTDTSIVNNSTYDTVICIYVLCVLEAKMRWDVLRNIQNNLNPNGIAYIAVRNDKPKNGWGVTSKGTYQGRVRKLTLPLLYKNSQFRIYTLTRNTELV